MKLTVDAGAGASMAGLSDVGGRRNHTSDQRGIHEQFSAVQGRYSLNEQGMEDPLGRVARNWPHQEFCHTRNSTSHLPKWNADPVPLAATNSANGARCFCICGCGAALALNRSSTAAAEPSSDRPHAFSLGISPHVDAAGLGRIIGIPRESFRRAVCFPRPSV